MRQALKMLQQVLAEGGFESHSKDDQLFFAGDNGDHAIEYRVYQSGLTLVLLGVFRIFPLPNRHDALLRFTNLANFYALALGNLEIDPDEGLVQFRDCLLLASPNPPRVQLQSFVATSLGCAATLAKGVAKVALSDTDPQIAASEMQVAFLSQMGSA